MPPELRHEALAPVARLPGAGAAPGASAGLVLAGHRVAIFGLVTRQSLSFAVAAGAQALGAEVVLAAPAGLGRLTGLVAEGLPRPAALLDAQSGAEPLRGVDGVFLPLTRPGPRPYGPHFSRPAPAGAGERFRMLGALARTLEAAAAAGQGRATAVVLHDFDPAAPAAWESRGDTTIRDGVQRLAAEHGPGGLRINLLRTGPVATIAAHEPGHAAGVHRRYAAAPLGWDATDPRPAADAACFLLSPLSARICGQVLVVDGGHEAAAATGC